MPTFGRCGGLPLKQDLLDILSRFQPPKEGFIKEPEGPYGPRGIGNYGETPLASDTSRSSSPDDCKTVTLSMSQQPTCLNFNMSSYNHS